MFDIILARCRNGVRFSDGDEVRAVFVQVGTCDRRNFHLRALSAIAQIAVDDHFEKRGMGARSEQALRYVVLLGKEMRKE